jgi:CelD/BcsL family acetyltransferase involved in cellulose biosynthesis
MPRIHVEIGPPEPAIAAHWNALIARASPNAFMNPVALNAAHRTNLAKVHVLTAWDGDPQRLVGLWALQERKIAPVWPAFLAAPPYDYAFVSNPVIDPAMMDGVMAAFLDAIERHPVLPNVIRLRYLVCNDADATFARRLISDLAAQQCASVALLRVDGRAIAAQVLLYCASTAYTWKTAFDAGYARFSPGTLLVDKITDELFSSDAIDAFESCSPEGGFMNQIWDGRRTTIDLLADVGTRESLNFIMAALGERGYAQLRGWRNRLRAASWSPYPKRKGVTASR